MKRSYLAIVNPAAGGGKSRKLLDPALQRLRAGGLEIEVAETGAPGDATRVARDAYRRGIRNFMKGVTSGSSRNAIVIATTMVMKNTRPKYSNATAAATANMVTPDCAGLCTGNLGVGVGVRVDI